MITVAQDRNFKPPLRGEGDHVGGGRVCTHHSVNLMVEASFAQKRVFKKCRGGLLILPRATIGRPYDNAILFMIDNN